MFAGGASSWPSTLTADERVDVIRVVVAAQVALDLRRRSRCSAAARLAAGWLARRLRLAGIRRRRSGARRAGGDAQPRQGCGDQVTDPVHGRRTIRHAPDPRLRATRASARTAAVGDQASGRRRWRGCGLPGPEAPPEAAPALEGAPLLRRRQGHPAEPRQRVVGRQQVQREVGFAAGPQPRRVRRGRLRRLPTNGRPAVDVGEEPDVRRGRVGRVRHGAPSAPPPSWRPVGRSRRRGRSVRTSSTSDGLGGVRRTQSRARTSTRIIAATMITSSPAGATAPGSVGAASPPVPLPGPIETANGLPPISRKSPMSRTTPIDDEDHRPERPAVEPEDQADHQQRPDRRPGDERDERRCARRRDGDSERRQHEHDEQRDPGRVPPPVEARPRADGGEPSDREREHRRPGEDDDGDGRVGEEPGSMGLRDHAADQGRDRERGHADPEHRRQRRRRDRQPGMREAAQDGQARDPARDVDRRAPGTRPASPGPPPRRGRSASRSCPPTATRSSATLGQRSPAGPVEQARRDDARRRRTPPAPRSRGSAPGA